MADTPRAPGTALVHRPREYAAGLGVTNLLARASGFALGAAGIAVRSTVSAVERFTPEPVGVAPTIAGPMGRLVRTVPGLALSAAYGTRATALTISGGVERSVIGALRVLGGPGPLSAPVDRAAASLEHINQWAFGEQRYNEMLVAEFTRRSAPVVAESLVASIDIPDMVGQLPVSQIVANIDLNAVIAEVDINGIIAGIDVRPIASQVLEEIDIPGIVRTTTTSLAGELVDANRVVFMYGDSGIAKVVDTVVRPRHPRATRLEAYDPTAVEERPGYALAPDGVPRTDRRAEVVPADAIRNEYARDHQGCRAGFASRTVAAGIDLLSIIVIAFLGSILVAFLQFLFTAETFNLPKPTWSASVTLTLGLALAYYTASWVTTGRTIGEAVMGLRVVTDQGRRVHLSRAFVRALFVITVGAPLLLWCIVSKRNNAVFDAFLRTAVIYDWTIN